MSDEQTTTGATCESHGHLWGPGDKCVMCCAPRPATNGGANGYEAELSGISGDLTVEAVSRALHVWFNSPVRNTVEEHRAMRRAIAAALEAP